MSSQIGQDAWALKRLDYVRGGTYVEFGAGDGLTNSNTAKLDFMHGWSGALAEPCKSLHSQLHSNRPHNLIKHECIGAYECDSMFVESDITEISTLQQYVDADHLANARRLHLASSYPVKCITLMQLLDALGRTKIDYLSIDTEGSEFDILQAFAAANGFEKYDIDLITVEHNFTANRAHIYELLTAQGYIRDDVDSQWDDWYYKE